MKHTSILITIALFVALIVPAAMAQGVTGITLQGDEHMLHIQWQAVASVNVDHYKIYHASKSIIENNGRFDGTAETIGDETELTLFDLGSRGYATGNSIYVTVTVIDATGKEHMNLTEEAVLAIGGVATHNVANPITITTAIAEDATTIRLIFSSPIAPIAGNPAESFTITDQLTNETVTITGITQDGPMITLTVTPMTPRARYSITAGENVTGKEGEALDENGSTAVFVARGGETEQTTTAPPPQSEPEPEPVPDTTPPENPTNLTLTKTLQSDGNYTVAASWSASLNTAQDLQSYNLYESANRGITFVGPTALRSTIVSTAIANVPPGTLTVKLAAMDRAGNESEGILETIILPETGGAALLMSLAGATAVARRRRKKSF